MKGLGETWQFLLKETLFFLVWMLPCILYAQPTQRTREDCHYHIHGMVVDQARKPIAGATILIKELAKGDATKITGDYMIEDICAGAYTLVCSYIGYESDTVTVQLSESNKYLTQNFRLAEKDVELRTVTIIEQKLPVPALQPTEHLEGLELESTRGKSLGESLKSITGVTTIQTGPSISKPVIHGLHSNRILILNAGIRQEGQQWGSEHAPEIDPFVASSLSVVKGAAGVRYGPEAIGGVILVEPAPLPRNPGLGGELNLVGWSNNRQGVASGIVEGNFKKARAWSWRLQGTAKRAGNAKAPGYYLKNSGVQEFNFSSALGYRKKNYGGEIFYSRFQTKIGIFAGAHIGNITDLERAMEYGAPLPEYESGFSYKIGRPYQQVTHQLLKANAFLISSQLGKFSLTYARQHNYRGEYDLHRPRSSTADTPELQYTLRTHTADLIWEH
jgi:iron complex outermembrane receptor protein